MRRFKKTTALLAISVLFATIVGCSSESAGLGATKSGQPTEPAGGIAKADPDTFRDTFDRVEQMDYAGPKLNESVDNDTKLVLQNLADHGYGSQQFFNRKIVAPRFDNTPQQIWDQITLGYEHVRDLARRGNVDEAKKLAAGVAEGDEYTQLVESFNNGGGVYSEVGIGHSDGADPPTKDGEYNGVQSNGLGLISFTQERLTTNEFDQVRVTARLTQGKKPNSARWILVQTNKLS